jgi:hypothetical protein
MDAGFLISRKISSTLVVLALALGTVKTLSNLAAALHRSGASSRRRRSVSSSEDAVLRAVVPDMDIRGLAFGEKPAEYLISML